MSETMHRNASSQRSSRRLAPSILPEEFQTPFSMDQELEPFGQWSSDTIWVPPKDSSRELAKSMLNQFGCLASKQACWSALIEEHRSKFTQVREIELHKESIRLPQGKLFVSLTEQKDFGKITDTIPNCVRTRLEEFLAGPGKRPGVKVYYLKPLCVEVGEKLIFTTQSELDSVVSKIQQEVFDEYRRGYLSHRPAKFVQDLFDAGFAIPRKALKHYALRRKRAIDAYHAKLEFNRRKAVLRVAKCRRKFRTDECTFDEILEFTKTPNREDVIEQYVIENNLSQAERNRLLVASATVAAVTLPWFMMMSLGIYYLSSITITIAPPILVCDPAFVAEMPDSKGVLLKIGHFDEVGGVMHVEI